MVNVSIAILKERTPHTFKVAHVAMGADYWCLDLDLHAPSQPEMERRIRETAAQLDPAAPLPSAPDSAWENFSQGTAEHSSRIFCPGTKYGKLLILYVRTA